MQSNKKHILLDHGNGGKLTHNLINDLFFKYFENEIIRKETDSALLQLDSDNIAFTTDSYVIQPIFFPGGDIGKLAVSGTVNDIAVTGADPQYLSCGFIIEEGLPFADLEKIVKSMAEEAGRCNVQIVTGDTKVVERGACDKLFINTSGIGVINKNYKNISCGENISIGDKIIVNGFIADHGIAILGARKELDFKAEIESDTTGLNLLIKDLLDAELKIRFMRDPTRGGAATVLCELARNREFGILLDEESLPVRETVKGVCELLGFDPLYVANEGKVIFVVDQEDAEEVLRRLQKSALGKESRIIGEIVDNHPGSVVLQTCVGGKRLVEMLTGAQLPRIC